MDNRRASRRQIHGIDYDDKHCTICKGRPFFKNFGLVPSLARYIFMTTSGGRFTFTDLFYQRSVISHNLYCILHKHRLAVDRSDILDI